MSRRLSFGVFAFVWLIYLVCPPMLSYDSYWTLATSLSLVNHGTTQVDRYVASAPAIAYGLECPEGSGHCYSLYPVGTAVLAAPLVAAIEAAVKVAGPLVPRTGPLFSRAEVRAFFAGDLMGGRPLTELACASFVGALTVLVQFRIALLFLPTLQALGLAMLFAFGTSEWSVASRNLMQHGFTLLLLSGALYFFVAAKPRLWAAGMLLALAFTVRPSNAISCAVLGIYTAVHLPRRLPALLAGALPVGVAFFAYQILAKHTWIPRYVRGAIVPIPPIEGALMHLFSPSRGLLVFTPIVVFSAWGIWVGIRRKWCRPLLAWLAVIPVLHFALIAGAWPGHGYGPRFTTDMMYLAIFFLIPAILWWQTTVGTVRRASSGAFVALALWSVFVHARGATSYAPNQWSALPENVDTARWRVWDWKDPQFLRGLR